MTKSTIKFIKDQLERLKFSGKGRFYYAENFEALAIYVGKDEKTYYAHWSEPVIDKSTGKIKRIGKKKRLDGFQGPKHLGINVSIANALNNKKPTLFGNGLGKRNYIFVEDAAKMIIKLIKKKNKGIFYLGGQTITFKKMFEYIYKFWFPNSKIIKNNSKIKMRDQISIISKQFSNYTNFYDSLKKINLTFDNCLLKPTIADVPWLGNSHTGKQQGINLSDYFKKVLRDDEISEIDRQSYKIVEELNKLKTTPIDLLKIPEKLLYDFKLQKELSNDDRMWAIYSAFAFRGYRSVRVRKITWISIIAYIFSKITYLANIPRLIKLRLFPGIGKQNYTKNIF